MFLYDDDSRNRNTAAFPDSEPSTNVETYKQNTKKGVEQSSTCSKCIDFFFSSIYARIQEHVVSFCGTHTASIALCWFQLFFLLFFSLQPLEMTVNLMVYVAALFQQKISLERLGESKFQSVSRYLPFAEKNAFIFASNMLSLLCAQAALPALY